jgi:hypothetical protein
VGGPACIFDGSDIFGSQVHPAHGMLHPETQQTDASRLDAGAKVRFGAGIPHHRKGIPSPETVICIAHVHMLRAEYM